MAVKEITPQQANETLSGDSSAVYIDVRTVQEFANGHPTGAVNIPVAFADPARGMVMNLDFVSVVEKNFAKDQRIIVGCQAGPRSTRGEYVSGSRLSRRCQFARRLRWHARSDGHVDFSRLAGFRIAGEQR